MMRWLGELGGYGIFEGREFSILVLLISFKMLICLLPLKGILCLSLKGKFGEN